MHTYSHGSYFNLGNHSVMQPIIKNKAENNIKACTSLAQATTLAQAKEAFRSSYRLSLRRDCFQRALQVSQILAWARSPRLSETALRLKETHQVSRLLFHLLPTTSGRFLPTSQLTSGLKQKHVSYHFTSPCSLL